ncbi:MAG: ribosomal L7Ae/L30e/S12e/Gadd45 family protein [Clostridia bacterium]|nr:ribosomal L7Ae/L30e/S12e/Gadd45 family protein [Clostridia bacterium]
MLPSERLHSYIGFSVRSRKIIMGADSLLRYRKKVFAVLMSDSINRTACGEVSRYCEKNGIPLVRCDDELLSACLHVENCKCIALLDSNLAGAALKELSVLNEVPNE